MAKTKAGYGTGRDVAALAENMELLTGQRGNKLDKAITYRELADIGLITLRKAANNSFTGTVAPGVLPDESVQRPVAPAGVIANGAFHTILVEWDMPAYKGHAYAEVWRADSDNRALAVMVGTSAANLYSDAIGKGATVYYWVRFVNRNDISGPFNAMAGVMAQTSRDVQDILDELEGKIKDSHLADELLGPIREVPNIKADLSDLDTALAKTDAALKALDAREQQVNDLLKSAQEQLGSGYISVTAIQETLRQKIEQYRTSFDDFRDAVFSVEPTTGEITMDAVNAVRNELGMEISIVSQHLDAVEAIVNTCVTRAEIQGDLERIVNIEQELDGINATLKQTATKSEVNDVSSKVSQVTQELDATNSKLTQKAAQSEVDAHGQRLSAAEQQISANTEADKATASRIEQVKAQLDAADKTISAGITELATAVATDKEATAQRLSNIEASVNGQSAAISDLQKVVSGDGQSIAGRFENIQASIDLSAKAAIGNTLASAEADRQNRNASGQIRRDQEVIVNEQKAQAQTIEDMRVTFEGELSDANARITTVQKVVADNDKSISERVDQIESSYKEADSQATASISALQQVVTDANSALSQYISRVESEYKAADSATASSISNLQKAISDGDRALGERIDTVQATANGLTSAVQTHSQAISDLKNGAEAMWTVKAQAGDIKAGIGLVAKSDGTSQVMVSASQFFVFNPNSPAATSPLFAIDNGQVVMAEAIIRTATIQILNSQQITADYVKAGVSLSAPVINGGQITIGTNFSVNSAGAMTAWSANLRYVTSIYGTFSQATIDTCTINNCTINENCDVRGTIYADKIVGGVITERDFSTSEYSSSTGTAWFTVLTINVTRASKQLRRLRLVGPSISVGVSSPPNNSMSYTAYYRITYNGSVMKEGYASVSATGDQGQVSKSNSVTINDLISIAATSTGQVKLEVMFPVFNAGSGGSSAKYSGGTVTARLFIDSEEMSAA